MGQFANLWHTQMVCCMFIEHKQFNLMTIFQRFLTIRTLKVLCDVAAFCLFACLSGGVAQAQTTLMDEEFAAPLSTSRWDVHDNNWYIHRARFGNAPQL